MATGGLIFFGILALWAVYLVPVLVRDRASRLDNRAADRTSPAVRVLQRPPAQRLSHRVVLTSARPLVSDALPARPTPALARTLRAQNRLARTGVRLRAAGALVGVVALLVTAVGAMAGPLPAWSVAAALAWLGGVVLAGFLSASSRRQVRNVPTSSAALPPRARRFATEVFDGREQRSVAAAPAVIDLRGAEQPVPALEVDRTWTPVQVPEPVYASKTVSHRPPSLPWSVPAATAATVEETAGEVAPGAAEAGDVRATPVEVVSRHEDDQRHSAAG